MHDYQAEPKTIKQFVNKKTGDQLEQPCSMADALQAQLTRRIGYRAIPTVTENGFDSNAGVNAILVAKGGIEPPTQGFSVLCSTN